MTVWLSLDSLFRIVGLINDQEANQASFGQSCSLTWKPRMTAGPDVMEAATVGRNKARTGCFEKIFVSNMTFDRKSNNYIFKAI